ncbi:MAG: DUF4340 domain-containing protein [bacterium]|nr:DUF4340 domain-containing protein [bacterium]
MNENKKTIYYIGMAVVLAVLAFIFAPKRITPEAFVEQGVEFFPEFTDPNTATSLEVVSFDTTTGQPNHFKVHFNNGRWTIPSHHDYPADAKDHLAKTAAGVIGIKRDDFRTDNAAEYEACGVLDPLNETAELAGRGRRITIKGDNNEILADLIIGKEVENRSNLRFVRLPDQKQVYVARVDLDLSTEFSDWIETDLMNVMKHRIEQITLKDYSIDERSGRVDNRDNVVLTKSASGWRGNQSNSGDAPDSAKMEIMLNTLDSLMIVGVRPKPAGMSSSLKASNESQQMNNSDIRSLQSKGFYVTRDGQLLSNEGELQYETADGVKYTLRFGEVVYGSGLSLTAGGGDASQAQSRASENRYLFITTTFDEKRFPQPKKPANRNFEGVADSLLTSEDRTNKELARVWDRWQSDVERGKKLSSDLNDRFADWYYVISSESFDKLHLKRSDLF